ncbi:MAG: hypothetical protein V1738_02435 [Patescibacteria group bacterium]
MSVQCLSLVVGTKACNAKCPFCISQQTGFEQLGHGRERHINFINLEEACVMCGTARPPTLLLTGKGEPTLYPNEITQYLEWFKDRSFAPKELQTNGLALGRLARDGTSGVKGLDQVTLRYWRSLRLGVIALSVVSINDKANATVYHRDYPPLAETLRYLRSFGFTIRLCVMMMDGWGFVSNAKQLKKVVRFCRDNDVGQLTARPITKAYTADCSLQAKYIQARGLPINTSEQLYKDVSQIATPLFRLDHGATVFDWDGQNVCLSNCLTSDFDSAPGDHRSLIVFPNGMVTTRWDHPEAAALLQGDQNYG